MKFTWSLTIAIVLMTQTAVASAARPAFAGRGLGGISLDSALPFIEKARLPILGGIGVPDLPLVGSFFGPLTLNQYIATGRYLPALLGGLSLNFPKLYPAFLAGRLKPLPGLPPILGLQ